MIKIRVTMLQWKAGSPNQRKYTHVNISLSSTGSTVGVKHEDGGPWTHRTIIGHGSG